MQFHVGIAFFLYSFFSDFESLNWFWLGKPFYARGWEHTCFSVAEAQLESTYLVAVCEVSQSDAECTQHKGMSGNSCLQFETLLPALGLCWLILCPAMSFCLLRKIQWNYTVNQMQCHHWNKAKKRNIFNYISALFNIKYVCVCI